MRLLRSRTHVGEMPEAAAAADNESVMYREIEKNDVGEMPEAAAAADNESVMYREIEKNECSLRCNFKASDGKNTSVFLSPTMRMTKLRT